MDLNGHKFNFQWHPGNILYGQFSFKEFTWIVLFLVGEAGNVHQGDQKKYGQSDMRKKPMRDNGTGIYSTVRS
jgi:hypothetical protein